MSKILSFPCLFLGNLSHTIYISLRLALESQSSDLLGCEGGIVHSWLILAGNTQELPGIVEIP
jgi:hypothetical protein